MSELTEITKKLGSAYAEVKKWDKVKSESRKEFFKVVSSQHETLASKFVDVQADNLAQAIELAETYHPGWTALSAAESENGYSVRMQENAEFKPFTFINHEDGMVYQKQIVAGSIMFDDERLKRDHPDIYDKVTFVPEPERQLKPFEEIEDELLPILQDYIYEGKPVVKLAAPRKAKPEELE